jgi:hypothetical protein
LNSRRRLATNSKKFASKTKRQTKKQPPKKRPPHFLITQYYPIESLLVNYRSNDQKKILVGIERMRHTS